MAYLVIPREMNIAICVIATQSNTEVNDPIFREEIRHAGYAAGFEHVNPFEQRAETILTYCWSISLVTSSIRRTALHALTVMRYTAYD